MAAGEEEVRVQAEELARACRGCLAALGTGEGGGASPAPGLLAAYLYCTRQPPDNQGDGYPKHFCDGCTNKINLCCEFMQNAKKVTQLLQKLLGRPNSKKFTGFKKEERINIKKEKAADEQCNSTDVWNYYSYQDDELKEYYSDDNMKLNYTKNDEESDTYVEYNKFHSEETDCENYIDVSDEVLKLDRVKKTVKRKRPRIKIVGKNKSADKRSDFQCGICNKKLLSKIWYDKHVAKVHKVKQYACDKCSKVFNRSDILTQHMVRHSENKPFACHLCHRKFKLRKSLNYHVKLHQQEPQYTCDICSSRYPTKSLLILHMTNHTNVKSNLCHLCGRGFAYVGNLRAHMRTHTGEKPHRCDRCPFATGTTSSLRRHIRVHDGIQTVKYPCETCGKLFIHQSSWIRHKRIHTGEKPYGCEFCGKRFIDSWKRKNHIIKVHNIDLANVTQSRKEPIKHIAELAQAD